MIKLQKKKTMELLIISLVLSFAIVSTSGCIGQSDNKIAISGANALQPMMEIWAREYQILRPEITITVTGGGAGKGMTEALVGMVDIGMVSREIDDAEVDQGAFWVSVAKDAVFATMNANNPVKDAILSKGVTRGQLVDIFTNVLEDRTIKTWGQLVNDSSLSNKNVVVYTRQDACGAADMWARFLGINYKQDNLTNAADVAIIEDSPLRDAVATNEYAIGYNNLNTAYSIQTKEPYSGILVIPIDFNENGMIDDDESFYGDSTAIVDAINANLYPSPPARDLHLVTRNSFTGIAKDFVYWILTEGQQYVLSSGYVQLSAETITEQIEYLESGMR